jgi:hypothetical protein
VALRVMVLWNVTPCVPLCDDAVFIRDVITEFMDREHNSSHPLLDKFCSDLIGSSWFVPFHLFATQLNL